MSTSRTPTRSLEGLDETLDSTPLSALAVSGATPPPAPQPKTPLLSLSPGQRLDRFEILSVLGRGGMGAVYEAFNHTLKRRVALKVLYASGPEVLEAIEREAQHIARLEHPNIVQVYHLGSLSGSTADGGAVSGGQTFYIEMQRVEGAPLSALMTEGEGGGGGGGGGGAERVPLERLISLVRQIAEALIHAHERGVVHRDIKPENALVTAEGVVKLIDFGIAGERSTRRDGDHGRAGTPLYMAPEVWREGAWGVASDLYAWGVMTYRLASGEPPFSAPAHLGWRGLMQEHLSGGFKPLHDAAPWLPERFCRLIDACLAFEPEARPTSARAVVDALDEVLDELSVPPESARAERAKGKERERERGGARGWLEALRGALRARRADLGHLGVVCALTAGAVWGELLDGPNHAALDLLQSLQPPPTSTPVGLVSLDETAYLDRDVLLEREALAGVVRRLLDHGARAVGVDLIHHRPSKSPNEARDEGWAALAEDARVMHAVAPLAVSEAELKGCALHNKSLNARAPKRKTYPGEGDQSLVRSWQALSLVSSDAEGAPAPPDPLPPLTWVTRGRHARLITEQRLLFPFAGLLTRASGLAHIGLYPDQDGVVRHVPLLLRSGNKVFPSLGLLLAVRSLGASLADISYAQSVVTIRPPGRAPIEIPVDECARLTLRVRGEPSQRPQAPLLGFMGDSTTQPPRDTLLLSPTALTAGYWGSLSHWRHAPLSLAHLLTAENILNGDFVRVASRRWTLALALLICVAAFWHAHRSRAGFALFLLMIHSGGAAALTLALFIWGGQQLPLVLLVTLTALASLYGSSVQSTRERARRHALTQRVGEALPPRLLERLLDGVDAQVDVPTRRAPLGVVAVHLEGLDPLSDEAPPAALTQAFSALSDTLHRLALQRGGLVVSAGRGGVMVTFKRETPEERAREATRFARDVREAWRAEVWRWRALGAPPALGVAVEEGSVALGPLSVSRDTFYGLHGVIAARAERLAREARDQTLVSERVARLIGALGDAQAEVGARAERVTQGPSVQLGGVETRSFYLEMTGAYT